MNFNFYWLTAKLHIFVNFRYMPLGNLSHLVQNEPKNSFRATGKGQEIGLNTEPNLATQLLCSKPKVVNLTHISWSGWSG